MPVVRSEYVYLCKHDEISIPIFWSRWVLRWAIRRNVTNWHVFPDCRYHGAITKQTAPRKLRPRVLQSSWGQSVKHEVKHDVTFSFSDRPVFWILYLSGPRGVQKVVLQIVNNLLALRRVAEINRFFIIYRKLNNHTRYL